MRERDLSVGVDAVRDYALHWPRVSDMTMRFTTLLVAVALVDCTPDLPRGADAQQSRAKLHRLVGYWRSGINSDTLVVQPDGRYRWGKPYSGRFSVLTNGQLVMSMRENGRWVGGMPVHLSVSADTVRLTAHTGAPLEFHRVLLAER